MLFFMRMKEIEILLHQVLRNLIEKVYISINIL